MKLPEACLVSKQVTQKKRTSKHGLYSPNSDVKDVAAHRTGHSHVPQALPGHDDTGDEVRDGGACCQYG